jgi:hypothetical protein
MVDDHLTPNERAYLHRLWRFHQKGTLDRRYKIIMSLLISIAIVLLAIPWFGIPDDWSRSSVWSLGWLTGFFATMTFIVMRSKTRFVTIAPFIDWSRIEAITAGGEK